jgi:beta-lactamase regulating signal transducer with metallopeptidase domain
MITNPDAFTLGIANWFLSFAVLSTLLLGAAILLARLSRRSPSWIKDLALKLALAGSLLLPFAQTIFPTSPVRLAFTAPVDSSAATTEGAESTENSAQGSSEHTRMETTQQSTAPVSSVGVASESIAVWVVIPLLLWIAGTSVLLVRYIRGWRRQLQRLSDRESLTAYRISYALEEVKNKLGLRRRIRLTTSDGISSPMALGLREICIPRRLLEDLDPHEARSILAHEIAHLRRVDPLWLIVFGVAGALLFFQPLVAVAMRRFLIESELICDKAAVSLTGDPGALARSLLKSLTLGADLPVEPAAACGMAGDVALVTERTERILKMKNSKTKKEQHLLGVILIIAVFILAGWAAPGAVIVGSPASDHTFFGDSSNLSPDIREFQERGGPAYTGKITWVDGTVHDVKLEVYAGGRGSDLRVLPVILKCTMDFDASSKALITIEIRAKVPVEGEGRHSGNDKGPSMIEKRKSMEAIRRIVNDLLEMCKEEDYTGLARLKEGLNKGGYKVTMRLAIELSEIEIFG